RRRPLVSPTMSTELARDDLHRTALPLRLLVPRRRLAARGARRHRARARLPDARADRPQRCPWLDGVCPCRPRTRVAPDPRRRAEPRRRPPSDAAGRRRARLAQPLPPADARPRPHPRAPPRPDPADDLARGGLRTRRGARLPDRLRAARRARRSRRAAPAR